MHDSVCVNYKEIGVKFANEHWYQHVPKWIEASREGKVIILWNQQVQTDRTIPNNEPYIIIPDNEKGTYMLVDAAITEDIHDQETSREDSKSMKISQ